ncbi:MAG: M15 family metallopeptidase [Spirochaetota bacterium]
MPDFFSLVFRKDANPSVPFPGRRAAALLLLFFIPALLSGGSVVVVDSAMSLEQALDGADPDCPGWILENQALIDVVYYGFDGKIHRGQVVADCRLADDIQHVFKAAYDVRFPVRQARPISVYGWDDFESMRQDNTSAFNYRTIPFTNNLSRHAYGWAIDINTRENPYYTKGTVYPEGAQYNPDAPGTLYAGHPVVREFKKRGWRWGGDWKNKDYQHFDIRLEEKAVSGNRKHYPWPWITHKIKEQEVPE